MLIRSSLSFGRQVAEPRTGGAAPVVLWAWNVRDAEERKRRRLGRLPRYLEARPGRAVNDVGRFLRWYRHRRCGDSSPLPVVGHGEHGASVRIAGGGSDLD